MRYDEASVIEFIVCVTWLGAMQEVLILITYVILSFCNTSQYGSGKLPTKVCLRKSYSEMKERNLCGNNFHDDQYVFLA